ncbi:n-terminal domain protein [Ichthyophthirius multifiliis]|uniref:Cyclin-dependent kinase 2 homolog n=1 Tax=Ichthyophthirius multifiliis TaxID=5932 RepID=G0QSS3_ICHMU|nr:n-terminal domain protein [Ichthyophthirius multifiliis]EGR31731.1 n-terminal domain protein [Ichthyophthirius multifiliis]|eukprot:XP_004035217.1 n-terminal domain protein [Ichthyophthirius multifiliis]
MINRFNVLFVIYKQIYKFIQLQIYYIFNIFEINAYNKKFTYFFTFPKFQQQKQNIKKLQFYLQTYQCFQYFQFQKQIYQFANIQKKKNLKYQYISFTKSIIIQNYKHSLINKKNDQKKITDTKTRDTVSPVKTQENNQNLINTLQKYQKIDFFVKSHQKKNIISFTSNLSIQNLPNELIIQILTYFSPYEIYTNIIKVNQFFYQYLKSKPFWQYLARIQKFTISDKYQKQSLIVERRSKGKLFRAISRFNDEKVIIRKINVEISNAGQDDGIPTSILRELSILKNLKHPNIIQLKESEINGVYVQIVNEQLPYNLKEYLQKNPIINNNNNNEQITNLLFLKKTFHQILLGVNYLHQNGILHRNLKIDNILLDEKNTIKISDFALSRQVTFPHIPYTPEDPKDRERSSREARRLWYRAPELLLRKSIYSQEVDVWSLGCLLAECVLGDPLFQGDSEIKQLFIVFKLLGSPTTAVLQDMCDNQDYNLMFPKWDMVDINDACGKEERLKKIMLPKRDVEFKKLKSLANCLGPLGMDLLSKMIKLNPKERISCAECLEHDFFKEIHTEQIVQEGQIYKFLQNVQQKLKIEPFYMKKQEHINEQMRVILVDWLMDVSLHFQLEEETLHYCIQYVDRILQQMKLSKQNLQLVGVVCMKIADVFNEQSKEYYKQENANEYAYITADEYNTQQLLDMEKKILSLLDFELNIPTVLHFVKIKLSQLKMEASVYLFSIFFSDILLMSTYSYQFQSDLLGNTCIFMANLYCKQNLEKKNLFNFQEKFEEKNSFQNFFDCFVFLYDFYSQNRYQFEPIYVKYSKLYNIQTNNIILPVYNKKRLQNWWNGLKY